jgi:hypothetical protein
MDKERRLREEKTAIERSRAQIAAEAKAELLAQFRASPAEFFRQAGSSYDEVSKRITAGDRPDVAGEAARRVDAVMSELQALKAEREAERAQAERRSRSSSLAAQVAALATEKFPLLHAAGLHDTVAEDILTRYEQTGELPVTEAVASEVEDRLVGIAKKWLELEAVKKLYAPAVPTPSTPPAPTIPNGSHAQTPPPRATTPAGLVDLADALKQLGAG